MSLFATLKPGLVWEKTPLGNANFGFFWGLNPYRRTPEGEPQFFSGSEVVFTLQTSHSQKFQTFAAFIVFMGKGRQKGVPGAGQGANWGLHEADVGQNSEGQAWAPKNEP